MLREWQRQLSRYLYDPNRSGEAELQSTVTPASWHRLEVYRQNLVFALLAGLREVYPIVEEVVSFENFRYFARSYIYANPSTHSDIGAYGEAFGDFLQTRPELAEIPWIKSLGTLEWHWYLVRNGAGPFTISLDYRVLQLWQAFSDSAPNEGVPEPSRGPEYIQLWRENDRLLAQEVTPRGVD